MKKLHLPITDPRLTAKDLLIATGTLAGTCLIFGFVNGWAWAWGAVCGIVGQTILIKALEYKKELDEIPPADSDPK